MCVCVCDVCVCVMCVRAVMRGVHVLCGVRVVASVTGANPPYNVWQCGSVSTK